MQFRKKENTYLAMALITVILTIMIVIYSEDAFYAALEGLRVWWEVVFPSLLPFFIIAEILMGLGVVHFLGALLEPLMRPLFKVPGVGAFALAMGLASGYPIGAKITANLRRKHLCSRVEAERLVSFTNTADPLFMVGAVAVGMFHRAELGIVIAGTHYISSILLGFIMRFYKNDEGDSSTPGNPRFQGNIFSNAFNELIAARKTDGRNLGQLLGDSVKESINTLLMIGGFIMLFSVVTRIITVTGLINLLGAFVSYLITPFNLSKATILPLLSGFFEITNGTNLASQIRAPLLEQIIVVNSIIAWSGLSVHAQVATMINGTDITMKPYIFARVVQGLMAGGITILFFRFSSVLTKPVFLPYVQEIQGLRDSLIIICLLAIGLIIAGLIVSLLIHFLGKIRFIFFRF